VRIREVGEKALLILPCFWCVSERIVIEKTASEATSIVAF